jgi:hypothetical protein
MTSESGESVFIELRPEVISIGHRPCCNQPCFASTIVSTNESIGAGQLTMRRMRPSCSRSAKRRSFFAIARSH